MDRFSGALVIVYSTQSLTDGYLARGRLEAEGIPVIMKGEGEGPYRMGPVHLLVPEELEVQARIILEEIQAGALQTPDQADPGDEIDRDEDPAEPD